MTEIGTVIDGKYEILKEIGRGGMSVVYLAMDKHLNKQWAVKEIRKKGSGKNDEIVVNSLLAEANMMKKLDHPALPRIVDIIDNGVTIYVVMDYIEGESLDKILNEYGAQPEELVVNWAKQLCDALSYLHSQKPPIIYWLDCLRNHNDLRNCFGKLCFLCLNSSIFIFAQFKMQNGKKCAI